MKKQQIHHHMDKFGVKQVSHAQIRFERLETRISPNIPFPHKHNFYQVLLITKGGGEHLIDFTNHIIKVRDLFIMKTGQLHSWSLKDGCEGIILEFNRESISFFKDSHILREIDSTIDKINLDKYHFDKIFNILNEGLKLSESNSKYHDLNLQAYLSLALTSLLDIPTISSEITNSHSVPNSFTKILEDNFTLNHNVDFYADKMGMTPKNLSMQISRSLGKPPREIIQERIILEAKRYLAFTDESIGEIALSLGFNDQNYFARFFKKMTKITPRIFRDRSLKHH